MPPASKHFLIFFFFKKKKFLQFDLLVYLHEAEEKKGEKSSVLWFFKVYLLSQPSKSLFFLLLNYRISGEKIWFHFALYSPLVERKGKDVFECSGDCLVFIR